MPKRFWCFPAVWPIRPQAPRLAKDMGWRGDPCHMHTISRHPRDWHMMEMAKQHITYIIIIDRFIAVDSWESVYNKMYICAKERDMTHIIFIYAVYNSKGCTIQLLWYIHLQKTTYTHRHIIYIYMYIYMYQVPNDQKRSQGRQYQMKLRSWIAGEGLATCVGNSDLYGGFRTA